MMLVSGAAVLESVKCELSSWLLCRLFIYYLFFFPLSSLTLIVSHGGSRLYTYSLLSLSLTLFFSLHVSQARHAWLYALHSACASGYIYGLHMAFSLIA